MGKLDSNMYGDTAHFEKKRGYRIDDAAIFAGIKIYPQLGFDPYPNDHSRLSKETLTEELDEKEDERLNTELNKVRFLYQFCCERRIPIITHCSDGGYKTGDNDVLTSPEKKWKKVLEEYPELTLNFAHFGSQSKSVEPQWRDAIIELSKQYPNVYTDISCNNSKPEYYEELEKLLNDPSHSELHRKVLFGSDFSINLLVTDVESYSEYMEAFAEATLSHQNDLCKHNPERFLFG
jgi:predicted TIM-barrel fold metal-dependent hydrolase